MQKSNFRVPVGLVFTLVIGLIGFKDTGIFVNSFNARLDDGTVLSFNPNDRADIHGEGASKATYLVKAEGKEFYVPKDRLLKVDNGIRGYKVVSNSQLLDKDGQVIRLLFLDEYLTLVEDKGDQALVKTEDGYTGLVSKDTLDPDRIRNIVSGVAKEDLQLDNSKQTYNVEEGSTVKVAWFEKDYYIIFDQNNNKFNVPKEKISIFDENRDLSENKEEEKKEKKTKLDEELEAYVKPYFNYSNMPTINNIIDMAHDLLGSPYVYGDTGKAGYDCSGMVYTVYGEYTDLKLPRSSRQMATVGRLVKEEDLEPGDLLFFNTTGTRTISHVALYIGDGYMIHASNSKGQVIKDSIENSYYFKNNFSHARRVLD